MKKSLALIGAGRWGKNLARNFYELGVLHTICDSDRNLLAKYSMEYKGVELRTSSEELFASSAIDKIAIATPAESHFALAEKALSCGKDLFIEKPLCLDIEEAKKVIALAESVGAVVMVGHLLHYHPIFREMEEMIKNGAIGELLHLSCRRLKLGTFRTQENVLWSFSPHDFSILLQLFGGSSPTSVRCQGHSFITEGVEDICRAEVCFPGGRVAEVASSWISPYKEQKIVAIGTKGLLSFDDTAEWAEKLTFVEEPIARTEEGAAVADGSAARTIAVEKREPLREELLHFLECCRERVEPRTSAREGLRTLELLVAAEKSMKNGGDKITFSSAAPYFAHESAYIDRGAIIGKGCQIWHFTHIFPEAEIGAGCRIGQNVVIFPKVRLGRGCKVQNNVSIYTGVTLDEEVFLGPSMVFTNVATPRAHIDRKAEFAATHIGRGATIGANATVVCGNSIGSYAFVGAGAVVTRSVKPFALVVGTPARQVGWVSKSGKKLSLPLASDEPLLAYCPETKERYCLIGDHLEVEDFAEKEQLCHA